MAVHVHFSEKKEAEDKYQRTFSEIVWTNYCFRKDGKRIVYLIITLLIVCDER